MLDNILLAVLLEILILLLERVVAIYTVNIFHNLTQFVNTVVFGPIIEEICKAVSIKFNFDSIFIPVSIIIEIIIYFIWYNKLPIDKKIEATGNSYKRLIIYRVQSAFMHILFYSIQIIIYKLTGLLFIGVILAIIMHMVFNARTFLI